MGGPSACEAPGGSRSDKRPRRAGYNWSEHFRFAIRATGPVPKKCSRMMKPLVASRPGRPSGRPGHPTACCWLDKWTTPRMHLHEIEPTQTLAAARVHRYACGTCRLLAMKERSFAERKATMVFARCIPGRVRRDLTDERRSPVGGHGHVRLIRNQRHAVGTRGAENPVDPGAWKPFRRAAMAGGSTPGAGGDNCNLPTSMTLRRLC